MYLSLHIIVKTLYGMKNESKKDSTSKIIVKEVRPRPFQLVNPFQIVLT
jgi:hypothetical protein